MLLWLRQVLYYRREYRVNSISTICDQAGADIDEIAAAIGRNTRPGNISL
jgi:UDP-glucose 6-dehydrogenase